MRSRFRKPKEVYAFVDSQNLNLGTQRMGWKMDWRRFRQFLRDEYGVTKAFLFIGYMPENESLYEYMHSLGYLVVLKPTLEILKKEVDIDDQEKEKQAVKGNVDTEIVLTAMKELPHYSKAVIVSGDGDFFGLIEYLISKNKLSQIITPNWQYSTLLKQFDKYITNLDKFKSRLAYTADRSKKNHKPQNRKQPR